MGPTGYLQIHRQVAVYNIWTVFLPTGYNSISAILRIWDVLNFILLINLIANMNPNMNPEDHRQI